MKLHKILSTYESPQMRVAVRNFRNRAIVESKVPQTGAYWWLPTPDGGWELDVYYDSEFKSNTMHTDMWHKYVLDRLAILWNKDPQKLRRQLKHDYTGLPRGRVSRGGFKGGVYYVSHGDNTPVRDGLKKVIAAFNLAGIARNDPKAVRIAQDEHETAIAGHPEAVQMAIGKDLGLRGSYKLDEFDDFDD